MRFPPMVWRWVVALLLALVLFLVPLPQTLPPWLSYLQWGLGALLAVCLLGKILYDTLFHNRYWP